MDDFNQIEVPPSFAALYTAPGGHRLTEPMRHVRERYELCEDLAQLLTEQSSSLQFKSGGEPAQVLRSIETGLSAEGGPVRPAEARWVVTRLAELLGWDAPAPD